MERCIEHRHLRHTGAQQIAGGVDTLQIGRIVQRRKADTVFYAGGYLIIDDHRFGEPFGAVHHAMSDGVDVGQ